MPIRGEAMTMDEEKAAFNARAKASMLLFLKSKIWSRKNPVHRAHERCRPNGSGSDAGGSGKETGFDS